MVSQAEHDEDSQCILVTKDKIIIDKVKFGIKKFIKEFTRKNSYKLNLQEWINNKSKK